MISPKILLVNDHRPTLVGLKAILDASSREHGYEIITAESGEEALRSVLLHQFAVIFLDISMPGLDGFETAQLIHSRELSAATPIIFITAYYADEINRLKGYELGAVDFLLTPVVPEVFVTKVNVFVELAKKNISLETKTKELEELNKNLQVKQMLELKSHNKALRLEIEERKIAETRAHELATKDPLTGLLNRRSLIEGLDSCLANALRRKESLAVMFLDLDKFKEINDTLGHDVGDQLLVQVAQRMTLSVRDVDIVARLGGDEFVIVLNNMSSMADAIKVVDKLLESSQEPFLVGSHSIKSTLSIGISLFPQDGKTTHILLKNADLAMYHTKKEVAGTVKFYSEDLNTKLLAHRQMDLELHLAVKRNEFELYYQPKVDISTRRVAGMEALIRWNHPERGLLEACEFIETATESGVIIELGDWAIAEACQQIQKWQSSSTEALIVPIAVNIAIPQIRPELIQTIKTSLNRYNIPADALQLEITESLLIRDLERTRGLLEEINDMGITIAIDDFGTGYSSLSLLKSLPIKVLKIDQSFIRNIATDMNDRIIVAAIVNMGQALGLVTVAEGVETDAQLNILKTLRCDEHQGFLFSKALAADELEIYLSTIEVTTPEDHPSLTQV